MTYDIVEVMWHDAHSEGVQGGTWFDKSQIEGKPYAVRSVGMHIVDAKEDHMTIAQSVAVNDGLMDSVLHIPMGMVLYWRPLEARRG